MSINTADHRNKIIPPSAEAEVNAMAELSDEDIQELLRLTTLFSRCMERRFLQIGEVGQ